MSDTIETSAVQIMEAGALQQQHKAELEAMVDTAKRYRRNLKDFEDEATTMACLDQDTATSMMYSISRGGKPIQGKSARLAEVLACAWGNLRYGARVVHVDATHITAQGFCFDAEKNTGTTIEVKRRITKRDGTRFDDDMIGVTGNAACSIALRNAILKIIPGAYSDKIYNKAKDVAVGRGQSLDVQRTNAMTHITKLGISEARILAAINRPSVKDISADDIITLRGLFAAVKNGEATVEEAFPEPVETADKATSTPAKVQTRTRAKAQQVKASEPKPETPQPAPLAALATGLAQENVQPVTVHCANEECNRPLGDEAYFSPAGDCCSSSCAEFVLSLTADV